MFLIFYGINEKHTKNDNDQSHFSKENFPVTDAVILCFLNSPVLDTFQAGFLCIMATLHYYVDYRNVHSIGHQVL